MKVNNKGFAITTLIYGLAILVLLLIIIIMATLSSMRSNIKDMAVQVEEELLSLSTSSVEYTRPDVNGNVFTTPINGTGYYRIEVWSPPNDDNLSTYASGIIRLDEKEKIYIYRGSYGGKKHVYLIGIEPDKYNLYTSDFYDKTFNRNTEILYADEDGARMNGATDEPSRKMYYSYRKKYYTYEMNRYSFINTKIIKNIPVEGTEYSNGKVTINKLTPDERYILDTINSAYWYLEGFIIDAEGPYDIDNPCKVYLTHDKLTTCFTIGKAADDVNDVNYNYNITDGCKAGTKEVSFPYRTGYDGSRFPQIATDLELICPSKAYEDTTFKISLRAGLPKKHTEELTYYTKVFHGKYRHNDGYGIKMTPYNPDSIVDKIDNGNYYLLAYGNEKYALTALSDGSSVSMKGLSGTNTQKWEISKIKNYNVTKNQLTSDEYNYFDHEEGTDLIDKAFKIIELSTFKALDIKYDENIVCNKISAQYTFNPLSFNEPQAWRLIPNGDGSYSIKTIVRSNNGDERVGYVTYRLPGSENECPGTNVEEGDIYISAMEDGKLKDNQKFSLFIYDFNPLLET